MDASRPTEASPRVLVVGATGRTGRHVVTGLLARGAAVRALVRHPLTAGLLEEVEVVRGDLDDPASVARAAQGAHPAFLLWHRFLPAGSPQVVDALAGHVDHVVHLSAADLGAEGTSRPLDGVWAEVEAAIEQAPVSHAFLRAGGFAANTLGWSAQVRRGDTVRIPFPRAARALVDERDLADVAVLALLEPRLADTSPTITGPTVLTQREQVETVGAALGRPLRVEEQPRAEALDELTATMGETFAEASLSHWQTLVTRPE